MVKAGEIIDVKYPFHWGPITLYEDGDSYETMSWHIGPGQEFCHPDDFIDIAHGEGFMRLTVISTHKPGKYPERVFYTREWTDPDGKTFGKGGLKICSVQKFERLADGYMSGSMYEGYKMRDKPTKENNNS